jgi:hypothetical protein
LLARYCDFGVILLRAEQQGAHWRYERREPSFPHGKQHSAIARKE